MNKKQFLPVLIWLLLITWLFSIDRKDFTALWAIYSLAFGIYLWIVFSHHALSLKVGLMVALTARLVSFFFDPLLSDDYFRFIWDGMLIHEGIHPMAYTPTGVLDHMEWGSVPMEIFEGLNSADYYSVYPPLAQGIFGLIYWISGPDIASNILLYKLVLLLTDACNCYLLFNLLKDQKLPVRHVLIYALNPLIILEFMGNLHMDGLMILGLLGAVTLSNHSQLLGSTVMMVFSVMSKMLTLILLPFMPKSLYWKREIILTGLVLTGSTILLWLSFGARTGWISSIGLWFQSFEFNASFYYLIRYTGYLLKGYNTIEYLGPAMAFLFMIGAFILWLIYLRSKSMRWTEAMLFVLTLYFVFSTTVHPWYIGTVLVLGVLSRFQFPVLWTYLVFLSYSHYQGGGFLENYWLIGTEYILLAGFMCWEFRCQRMRRRRGAHKKALA